MLTPIRVRGRRKKKSNGGVVKLTPSGRKGGRPLLSRAAAWSSSQRKVDERARLLRAKPKKPFQGSSMLERLPVELIERIFLYSLNVNLPRSSPSLAAAVSSERIYRALILLAFWNDLEGQESSAAISRILRPIDYAPLSEDERGNLQATILRCQWCTVHRILNQLPDMMHLTIHRHWLNTEISMETDQQKALDRFLSRKEDTRTFEGTAKNNTPCTLTIIPLVSVTITRENLEPQTHYIISVKHIPDKLLQGTDGFGEEHIKYLETLRVASGFTNPDILESNITFSREALQQGIHMSLVENNSKALSTLLKLDEYTFRSQHPTHQPSDTTPPYTLPAEHFRTAVRVARNDHTFFHLLLRANAESVPADDAEITEWAMSRNDAFGRWLLDLMLHLPQQVEAARENPREAGMFWLGRANGGVEMARRYLGFVLDVEELGCWVGESCFDLSSEWIEQFDSDGD